MLGYGDGYTFLDDGASCHRSYTVTEWKAEYDIRCLEWPAGRLD